MPRPPTCTCGTCDKCKRRAIYAAGRAAQQRDRLSLPAPVPPAVTPHTTEEGPRPPETPPAAPGGGFGGRATIFRTLAAVPRREALATPPEDLLAALGGIAPAEPEGAPEVDWVSELRARGEKMGPAPHLFADFMVTLVRADIGVMESHGVSLPYSEPALALYREAAYLTGVMIMPDKAMPRWAAPAFTFGGKVGTSIAAEVVKRRAAAAEGEGEDEDDQVVDVEGEGEGEDEQVVEPELAPSVSAGGWGAPS